MDGWMGSNAFISEMGDWTKNPSKYTSANSNGQESLEQGKEEVKPGTDEKENLDNLCDTYM